MTTPNEREARQLLAQHCECGGTMQYTKTDDCIRAIIAALTTKHSESASPRDQREGECPACGLAWGEHRLGYAASSCKAKPQQEAPGAVAMWRAMTASGKWMYFDHEPTHMSNYQRLYTTPPAPVDVRLRKVLRLLDNVTASTDTEADYLGQAENMIRVLLDGQQAGVDRG